MRFFPWRPSCSTPLVTTAVSILLVSVLLIEQCPVVSGTDQHITAYDHHYDSENDGNVVDKQGERSLGTYRNNNFSGDGNAYSDDEKPHFDICDDDVVSSYFEIRLVTSFGRNSNNHHQRTAIRPADHTEIEAAAAALKSAWSALIRAFENPENKRMRGVNLISAHIIDSSSSRSRHKSTKGSSRSRKSGYRRGRHYDSTSTNKSGGHYGSGDTNGNRNDRHHGSGTINRSGRYDNSDSSDTSGRHYRGKGSSKSGKGSRRSRRHYRGKGSSKSGKGSRRSRRHYRGKGSSKSGKGSSKSGKGTRNSGRSYYYDGHYESGDGHYESSSKSGKGSSRSRRHYRGKGSSKSGKGSSRGRRHYRGKGSSKSGKGSSKSGKGTRNSGRSYYYDGHYESGDGHYESDTAYRSDNRSGYSRLRRQLAARTNSGKDGHDATIISIIVHAFGPCHACGGEDADFTDKRSKRSSKKSSKKGSKHRRDLFHIDGPNDDFEDHNENSLATFSSRALGRDSFVLPGTPTEAQLLVSYAAQIQSMDFDHIHGVTYINEFDYDECDNSKSKRSGKGSRKSSKSRGKGSSKSRGKGSSKSRGKGRSGSRKRSTSSGKGKGRRKRVRAGNYGYYEH